MKARIKRTGEILNVASYAAIAVDKCDDWGNPVEYPINEVEIIPDMEPIVFHGPAFEPDWEQRRYEIARDCFPKTIGIAQSQTIYSCTSQRAAELAVIYANALIKELKKTEK